MKSLLILLIAIPMIFPATIFANNRSISSSITVKELRGKLATTFEKLSKEGWESRVIKKSNKKSERQMINNQKGLAVKVVSKRYRKKLVFLVAAFKAEPADIENIFDVKNQLGYKRFSLDMKKIRANSVKVKVELDNAFRSLETEIKHKLIAQGKKTTFLTKIFDILIPSARADSALESICTIVGALMVVVVGVVVHFGIYLGGAVLFTGWCPGITKVSRTSRYREIILNTVTLSLLGAFLYRYVRKTRRICLKTF